MSKRTKKPAAIKVPVKSAAELHEAARVARRSGRDAESKQILEAARKAEKAARR